MTKSKTSKEKSNIEKIVQTEWFVLKGETKFGPFQYPELIRLLQEKVVFEFDYVWMPGMEVWTRIAELEHFNPENIKAMQKSLMPEAKEVFFRRKYKRVGFAGEVLIHDNKKVWKGQAVELSEGGAGLIMENSLVVPGQTLYMHFKSKNGLPAFNAICEVVSKKYLDGIKDLKTPICYGVKFKTLSGNTQKSIKTYAAKSASTQQPAA